MNNITSQPKVSIIILNWNGLEDTIECLESLKNITYPNYEVIVVDNGSQGNDAEVLAEKFKDYIRVIENDKNYGFPEGNNIAIRQGLKKGIDYFFLLNNDTTIDPACLTELVKVGESDELIGILGPKIYYYDRPDVIWSAGYKLNWWSGLFKNYGYREKDIGQCNEVTEREHISGAAMLIKQSVLQKVGLLDSAFFCGVEDGDMCTRAERAGFRVFYVPSAMVWHKAVRSISKLATHQESFAKAFGARGLFGVKNKYRFFRKHSKTPLFIIPVLLHFPVFLPWRAIDLMIKGEAGYVLAEFRRWMGWAGVMALLGIKRLVARRR